MAFNYKHVFNTPSVNSVALLQTLAGAGNLLINGALAQTLVPNDGGSVSFFAPTITSLNSTVSGGYNVPVTLTSTGNLSGVTFTITGYQSQPYNPAILTTETISGPSNNTVSSVNFYNRILSISANAAVGTAVSAGTGINAAVSRWLPLDGPGANSQCAVAVFVTGTINYTIQHTYDNVFNSTETINVFTIDDPSMVNATTTQDSNYLFSPRAVRILINSGTGSLIFYVNQSGLVSSV